SQRRWILRDRSRFAVGQRSPVPLRRGDRPDAGADAVRPATRHPARTTTESTAGLLAPGSPPVTAFPGCPSGNVAPARRLQLRGQLRPWNFRPAPHSLFALARETVGRRHLTVAIRALSMPLRPSACGRFPDGYSRAGVDAHLGGAKKGTRGGPCPKPRLPPQL